MTKSNWHQNNNQLTASTQDLPDAQIVVTEYQSLLRQWQSLSHPAILAIDESSVDIVDKTLQIKILANKIYTFKPSKTVSLLPFDKLFIMKQTIDLDHYAQQDGLNINWEMACLYLHQTGLCAWLPPLPSQVLNPPQPGIINFLFELLGLENNEIANWKDLIQAEKIPWEWGAFIEHYLADNKESQLSPTQVFSFIFYQAWLYTTANRLGMKDKTMTKTEYDSLYKFGLRLGLSDQEIQHLNIIAQQQHPSWQELIAIL